jgi:hypothetical protein
VVLELKAAGTRAGRTMAQAINEGLRQLEENDYSAELRAAGIKAIHTMAIAFDGKKVVVKPGGAPVVKEKRRASRKASGASRKATKKAAPKGNRK